MSGKAGGAAGGALAGAQTGMAFGPWGAAIGAVVGGVAGLFSKKKAPKKAELTSVDFTASGQEAMAANSAMLPEAQKLAGATNTFNQDEALRLAEQAMPGFTALRDKYLAAAEKDLDSEYKLPEEISRNITRLAAERGVSIGGRGQFQDFSLLRDFGFNMVDWSNAQRMKSLNTLSTISGIVPRVNPMSPAAFFINPGQVAQQRARENEIRHSGDAAYNTMKVNVGNENRAQTVNSYAQIAGGVFGMWNASRAPKTPNVAFGGRAGGWQPDG